MIYIVVRAHEKRGNLPVSIVHKPAIHYILHVQYKISNFWKISGNRIIYTQNSFDFYSDSKH